MSNTVNGYWHALLSWVLDNNVRLLLSLLVLALYVFISRRLLPLLEQKVRKSDSKRQAIASVLRGLRLTSWLIALVILFMIWGADVSGILLVSTSLITLTGVALFANWSIISNVTAYWILIFDLNYQTGIRIRVLDGDNFIEGQIEDIGLFQTRIKTADGGLVLYPNNLLLTRPTLINPTEAPAGIGKVNSR